MSMLVCDDTNNACCLHAGPTGAEYRPADRVGERIYLAGGQVSDGDAKPRALRTGTVPGPQPSPYSERVIAIVPSGTGSQTLRPDLPWP